MVRHSIAAFVLAGCGSNTPSIPPELLGSSSGCSSPNYPAGPYGIEEGSTLQNLCFRGWRNPSIVTPHDETTFETVAFSDYFDPQGTKGFKLLVVNTAAVWCSACQEEHKTLPARFGDLSGKGLVIVGTLFQDRKRDPSTVGDLAAWAENFGTNFPWVLDPDYHMGIYASAETAPLNLVIDAKRMVILRKIIGDQPAVIWPFIEQYLAVQPSPSGADTRTDAR